jgi:small-conductance mechanosensitive channel
MSPNGERGGTELEIDEGALYVVVRKAVEDAILGVIERVLLVVLAFFVVWGGIVIAGAGTSTLTAGAGVAVVALGFYVGAATFGLVPPVAEWV